MSDVDAMRALMQADRWIDRVQSQRSHLPEITELTALEEELRVLVGALRRVQEVLAPVRRGYEAARDEAQRLAQRASELNATLATSSANARELTALQRELEHVRDVQSRAEDRELDALVELEPIEQEIETIKARAQPAVARRGELQDHIRALQSTLDDELVALHHDRSERTLALTPELLARYDHAKARSGIAGAAQVDAGRCDGCRIALSPLDVDRWKAQPDGSFTDCPECGRVLLP